MLVVRYDVNKECELAGAMEEALPSEFVDEGPLVSDDALDSDRVCPETLDGVAEATRDEAPVRRGRVLVIASRFPPVASVGAIRVRKFVKHLRQFGWDSTVITGAMRAGAPSSHDARRAADHESLSDLPENMPVHRMGPVVDNWPGFASRYLSGQLARFTRVFGMDQTRWAGCLKWRMQRMHDSLSFPDRGIWRLPAAVRLAVSLHRRHRFDAIFSTGMPFSDHIIGLAVQSILRRPWIVDFRDPWVEYIHWQQYQGAWGQRLIRSAEAAVIRRASVVVSVNDHMTSRFQTRYERQPTSKFVTVPNGFDPDDFPTEVRATNRSCFRLLYAGSLYETRSPKNVLEAFRLFLASVPGSPEHARFDFAGRPGPHVKNLMHPSDDGRVRYLGMLTHNATARMMAGADVNVIILPNLPGSENDTTTKLYECIGSGRPILAAVPRDGAAARELAGVPGVWMCDPDDIVGMVSAITEMYRAWLGGKLDVKRPVSLMRRFTRQSGAKQLAACLNQAVAASKRPSGGQS